MNMVRHYDVSPDIELMTVSCFIQGLDEICTGTVVVMEFPIFITTERQKMSFTGIIEPMYFLHLPEENITLWTSFH